MIPKELTIELEETLYKELYNLFSDVDDPNFYNTLNCSLNMRLHEDLFVGLWIDMDDLDVVMGIEQIEKTEYFDYLIPY